MVCYYANEGWDTYTNASKIPREKVGETCFVSAQAVTTTEEVVTCTGNWYITDSDLAAQASYWVDSSSYNEACAIQLYGKGGECTATTIYPFNADTALSTLPAANNNDDFVTDENGRTFYVGNAASVKVNSDLGLCETANTLAGGSTICLAASLVPGNFT